MYLCYKTIKAVKNKFENITVFVEPIVLNESTLVAGGFEYYLSKKDLSYKFIKKIKHPNIEPIRLKIIGKQMLREVLNISDMFTEFIDESYKIEI